jgi:HD-like signal output (HDOD) protein
MLGRWFRRFFLSGDRVSPGASTRGARPPSAGDPTLIAAADPHSSGTARDRSYAEPGLSNPARPLTETLHELVVQRLLVLLEELPPPMQDTDAPAVLGALAEDVAGMLRQPPVAAQRALAATRDSNGSVVELVRLFEGDPSLTQALLRHANSAYYSVRHGRCLSLPTAVERIGTAGVENVVLDSMIHAMFCRPGGSYDRLVQQVWSHMVRTAPIARRIAPAFGVEPERAFTLALLHDAGKLVLFDRISTYRKERRREVDVPHHLLLWALKRLHEPLGGLATLGWGLEEEAVRAIATHHREPPPEGDDRLSEVVFLAEKVDLASLASEHFNLDALWTVGRLSADIREVREILDVDELAADSSDQASTGSSDPSAIHSSDPSATDEGDPDSTDSSERAAA